VVLRFECAYLIFSGMLPSDALGLEAWAVSRVGK
jgi:hypothetical protein